jgi:hypothetical protein
LVFIKTSINDSTVLLAGIEKIKPKGFFLMYDYVRENKFKEILNTTDSCENGIPVFNNSIECTSYKPFMLTIKNVDINNDGILDINFSGQMASYCKGLETEYGRNDRLPISISKINFSLILKHYSNNHFRCNFFPKDSICNLIR